VRRLWGDQFGTSLPLALLLMLSFLWFALPLLSWVGVDGTRVMVQRAADAAALAGASQSVLTEQTDARGAVYCETVTVDPREAPAVAARYWRANTSALRSLRTSSFAAVPSGNRLTVRATVSIPPGAFVLWGFSELTWSVEATAEAVQPATVPAC
jgi:hypothetical protein